MNLDGLSSLAARLRAIPTLGAEIAKQAAPDVLSAVKATAAAGTTPDGRPWPLRKGDGARAMPNAADALSVETLGDLVVLVLSGAYVYNQKRRPILPEVGAPIPKMIAAALERATRVVLRRSR